MSDNIDAPSRNDEEDNAAAQQNADASHRPIVPRAHVVAEHYLESIFYLSISAILGSSLRVYMARIFGSDCQAEQASDFLVPFSSRICVTNNGRTEQTGGALFTDFPANVLGR